MVEYLVYGVQASFVFCVAGLIVVKIKASSFKQPKPFSKAAGNPLNGAVYALTKGMMPSEKDSAKNHPFSYTMGIIYHLGIFSSLISVMLFSFDLIPSSNVIKLLGSVGGVGGFFGFLLFLKRILSKKMRAFSNGDDYVSNIFVSVFCVMCCVNSLVPFMKNAFFISAVLVFVIAPFGKIKHCVLFFSVRIFLGTFFGRRGVLGRHKGMVS